MSAAASPPRVAFRADASPRIGTGHVMRCMTLADSLAARGADCRLLCREIPDRLAARAEARGIACTRLPACNRDWRSESAAARAALAETVDWLVVDHYGLDARWEAEMRRCARRIMAIDDLADRPHDADLLLDQGLARRPEDYAGRLPEGAQALLGPRHALLRPEFAARRAEALAARGARGLGTIVVSMGGADPLGATARVLEALAALQLPETRRVIVALGGETPTLGAIRARAESMPLACELRVGVGDMAELFAEADLAIGAGGGTAWECCAVGLPSVFLTVADNQHSNAAALDAAGAALWAGDLRRAGWRDGLRRAMERLRDGALRAGMSAAAARLCDGDGVLRVAAALFPGEVTDRPARLEDSRRVWEWRREGGAARFTRQGSEPAFPDHHRWFVQALGDPARRLRIIETGGLPVGYLRLDLSGGGGARVSVCFAEAARGQGLGRHALGLADRLAKGEGLARLTAEIASANGASLRLFEAAGYAPRGEHAGFLLYEKRVAVTP